MTSDLRLMCDNRYGTDQEVIEVPEKDLMEKVSTAVSLELLLKNSSPGSPDLDTEPAALLRVRDVQGQQLQI